MREESKNLVCDMAIDPIFGDGPVNDVARPVSDVTTAVCNMQVTGVTTTVTDAQPLSFIVSSSNKFLWKHAFNALT